MGLRDGGRKVSLRSLRTVAPDQADLLLYVVRNNTSNFRSADPVVGLVLSRVVADDDAVNIAAGLFARLLHWLVVLISPGDCVVEFQFLREGVVLVQTGGVKGEDRVGCVADRRHFVRKICETLAKG